jgi:hypothetical protein
MRSNTTQQNIWAQLGASACALLLPPVALGAAVFSMLPARDEGAGRPAPGAAGEAHVTTPKSRIEAAWPTNADSQSLVEAAEPLLATGKPPLAADGRSSVSSTNSRQEPVGKKDVARVSGPVPVHVTVVTPPAAADPPPSADADSATTGSIGGAPWPAVAMETPAALLPRVPTSPIQVPLVQVPPPQVPLPKTPPPQRPASQALATQAPTAERPSAEDPPAPASSTAHKNERPSDPKTLAGHSGAHAEARSGMRAVHRNAQPQPQPQQTFSLKNWLQQLGTQPRNTRG